VVAVRVAVVLTGAVAVVVALRVAGVLPAVVAGALVRVRRRCRTRRLAGVVPVAARPGRSGRSAGPVLRWSPRRLVVVLAALDAPGANGTSRIPRRNAIGRAT